MAEYIDRETYCAQYCLCNKNYCDKGSCPLFKIPAADVTPVELKDKTGAECALSILLGAFDKLTLSGIVQTDATLDAMHAAEMEDDDDTGDD